MTFVVTSTDPIDTKQHEGKEIGQGQTRQICVGRLRELLAEQNHQVEQIEDHS